MTGAVNSGTAVLLDSAVPLYALGADSALRDPCLQVLQLIATDELLAFASTEMIQEVVHHRLRKTGDRGASADDGRDLIEMCTVLDFSATVLDLALDLIEQRSQIRGRDAVHAATALLHGIDIIISPDPAFDDVPGVRRISPEELTLHR